MTTEPNYRRTKQGLKSVLVENANAAAGPTSQIPGLSQSADTAPEERTKGRRVGIFDSDSDYVKLAKSGGHKGLLSHDDTDMETQSNKSYMPPDWFSVPQNQSNATSPDAAAQGLARSPRGPLQPLAAPFGTDDASSWGGPADSKEKSPVLSPVDIEQATKYKRTSYDKKTAAPVSMSKLLSFGYAEEEKKSDDDASSMTSELTSSLAPEEELE